MTTTRNRPIGGCRPIGGGRLMFMGGRSRRCSRLQGSLDPQETLEAISHRLEFIGYFAWHGLHSSFVVRWFTGIQKVCGVHGYDKHAVYSMLQRFASSC